MIEVAGDLWSLLEKRGHPLTRPEATAMPFPRPNDSHTGRGIGAGAGVVDTHGTTVIAVKFDKGVINVGDRRATANFAVMFDKAEKVLPIDDYTLLAISGSFARAMEVVRYLRTTFKLFERTYLQSMSLDGKLAELAKVVRAGIPDALQGIGGFIPILTTFDRESNEGRIFFYDGMGARFESAEFGAAGSGSMQIRGVFDYIVKTKKPFHEMNRDEALKEALLLLDIAADLDAATGGWAKVLPLATTITSEGIEDVPEEELRRIVADIDREGGEKIAPRR
ncbi:MAG: proteasome, alpha and beta subunit [Chthonomonadaceae bacterium]|nr:proteasome, alpha and beta subunit [Chthonomonadaceae bacterium]